MGKKAPVFTAMLGNILEHYDSAIFGVLSPFIAPIFFCDRDPLVALMLTYLLIPLGILMRPLGALFFGRIGDLKGRKAALSTSLIGMAISTMVIGCLPTYARVGLLSPTLLLVCRLSQGFFAAGETSGGAIYLIESTNGKRSDFLSSLFDSSTIVGIFLASLLVTLFAKVGIIENGWRYLFWMGGGVAFFGVFMRRYTIDDLGNHKQKDMPSTINAIKTYFAPFLTIVIASGFSHATYTFPFVLMSGFVPLVSTLSKTQLIEMNTYLLIFDLCLLPLFGIVAEKIGRVRLMTVAAAAAAAATPLCFWLLDLTSLVQVAILRGVIVTCGVAFAAAYHSFAVSILPMQVRYTLISLASALGGLFLGKPVAAISLALYEITGSIFCTAAYFTSLAALVTFTIIKVKDRVYEAYR